nr:general odorant-binding protein 45-like [Aedes albopictus]
MMQLNIASAILTLFVTSASCSRHKIVEKSLSGTGTECRQYDPPWDCMARCQTLLTRDWTDSAGMRSPYDRFFRPVPNDRCNMNRTQRCLQDKPSTIPYGRTCLRANESVQCFLSQFGEVIMDQPKYVAPSRTQEDAIFFECGAMLGFSRQRVAEVLYYGQFSLPEVSCLVRCFLIRSGLYSDNDGLTLERFYVACGGYDEEFYRNVTLCIANVESAGLCDKCAKAQRLALECIGKQYPLLIPLSTTNIDSENNAGRDVNNYYTSNFNFYIGDTITQVLGPVLAVGSTIGG